MTRVKADVEVNLFDSIVLIKADEKSQKDIYTGLY